MPTRVINHYEHKDKERVNNPPVGLATPETDEAIEFYKHRHGWSNRLVAGDSLLVMNSLLEKDYSLLPRDSRIYRLVSLWPASYSESAVFPVVFEGHTYAPPAGQCWPTGAEGMARMIATSMNG